jgi:hypothetical protein
MLETEMTAGKGLDPYIVWYNGKKRIYEGSVAEGAGRFLWQSPDQTGFYTLRAEAFPFNPASDLKGAVKELSLPVSAKNENTGAFFQKADQFTNWYQFAGNLWDSKAPAETNGTLAVQGGHPVRWLPAGSIYGLTIGPGDAYQLLLYSFIPGDKRGGGQFVLRFNPVSEGAVFSALFKGKGEDSSLVTLDLSLSSREDGMILGLNFGGKGISIPISSELLENEAFITAVIDFSIEADRFTAALSLENPGTANPKPVAITLSDPLTGEGTFRLGGSPEPAKGEKNDKSTVTAILDEFAVSDRATPLVSEKTSADSGESA